MRGKKPLEPLVEAPVPSARLESSLEGVSDDEDKDSEGTLSPKEQEKTGVDFEDDTSAGEAEDEGDFGATDEDAGSSAAAMTKADTKEAAVDLANTEADAEGDNNDEGEGGEEEHKSEDEDEEEDEDEDEEVPMDEGENNEEKGEGTTSRCWFRDGFCCFIMDQESEVLPSFTPDELFYKMLSPMLTSKDKVALSRLSHREVLCMQNQLAVQFAMVDKHLSM